MLTKRDWYLKQIKSGLPMQVKLANGREFVILSVSGAMDNAICQTKNEYESAAYAIEQNFNEFWDRIISLIPHYSKGR